MDEKQKMIEALKILQGYNHIRNDLDSYLFEVVEWALGERQGKPDPADWGIE